MLKTIKETIKDLAFSAVNYAEDNLKSTTGTEKKKMAINFIIMKLPIIAPLKGLVAIILSKFIDNAIENAVQYIKSKQEV